MEEEQRYNAGGGGAGRDQDRPASAGSGAAGSQNGSSQQESSELTGSDETDEEDRWPPRPPLLRFKMRVQFSNRFQPMDKALFEEMNADLSEKVDAEQKSEEMGDMIVGWLNSVFDMSIKTEFQFENSYPIIILTMLDAIYPKRVRWREVDWLFQYKRAMLKNYGVLEKVWAEVNMEKAREFRVENTSLRLENMPDATMKEKLEFIKLMKRWYHQRIHHSGPYDAMAKRRKYVLQCKAWGHTVKFPPWINFIKEEDVRRASKSAYDEMPEYKRLIWFLGSPEHQTM